MTEIVISKSNKKDKKYDARIDGKKTISFGAKKNGKPMDDYTITKDDEQKKRYIDRHKSRENWNDHNTAGFYAKNLLWNKKTLTASIRDTNSKFKNIKIKYA